MKEENQETGTITIFYKGCERSTYFSGISKDSFEHLNNSLCNYVRERFFKPNDWTYRLNAKKYTIVLVLSDISSIQWVGDDVEVKG